MILVRKSDMAAVNHTQVQKMALQYHWMLFNSLFWEGRISDTKQVQKASQAEKMG